MGEWLNQGNTIMKNTFLFISALALLFSCQSKDPNKQIDEGKVTENFYTSEEIGWRIEIPEGWSVQMRDQIDSEQERGQEAVEETLGQDIDMSTLKNLIHFEKDPFNSFQSSSEPFELEYEGEFEANTAVGKKIIFQTFIDQGIKTDSTATTIERINGLDFLVFGYSIYDRQGKKILSARSYNRLINGYDFCASLYYNSPETEAELMKVWKNSQFKR